MTKYKMKDIFQNMNQYTQLEDMDCNLVRITKS